MNKTCKTCQWKECIWLDWLFCVIRNRCHWQFKNPLPTGEFYPFPKANINVPMPEVKPAKSELFDLWDTSRKIKYEFENIKNKQISWMTVGDLKEKLKDINDDKYILIGEGYNEHYTLVVLENDNSIIIH
jgi:hypothetical protein